MFELIKQCKIGETVYELLFSTLHGNYQVFKNNVIQFAGNIVDAEQQFDNLTQRWGS